MEDGGLESLGRYVLLDRIATGGMAEVYRAVARGLGGFQRTLIVKRILAHKASSPDFIRMFCDEARISALLHHPNIAQVYDFGCASGCYFLTMEYLPGKDLLSLLRVLHSEGTSMPPGLAAYVTREAALGLHYAHTLRDANGGALGIVHRDVSPSNIMLLFAGGVKLLDFGIAKTGAAADREAKSIKGKIRYLSPEQVLNEPVDGRADVFALGITLWEMLVGERLFASKDHQATLRNVLGKPIPPPSSLRPQIPRALDMVVLRALERQKAKRYATAEELACDCDAVLHTLRADSLTLRAFLKKRFIDEARSPTLAPPVLAPPRADQALDDTLKDPRGGGGRRLLLLGGTLLAAGALIAVGVARDGRKPPALQASAPREAPRPIVDPFLADEPIPIAAARPSPTAAAPLEASPVSGERSNRYKGAHHRGPRELPSPVMLNQ